MLFDRDSRTFFSNRASNFLCSEEAKNHEKKKTLLYKERDEEKGKEFLKELNNIPLDKRIYLDESGINQHLCREYGRSPRGEKIIGEISGTSFARESFIAALSQGRLMFPMCFQGTCNTGLFNTWLEEMVVTQLQPGQVLILDNASFHRSEKSKQLVEAVCCKLMFLPPYSPDLNPIEKCWANLKARTREFLSKFSKFTDALDAAILSM